MLTPQGVGIDATKGRSTRNRHQSWRRPRKKLKRTSCLTTRRVEPKHQRQRAVAQRHLYTSL